MHISLDYSTTNSYLSATQKHSWNRTIDEVVWTKRRRISVSMLPFFPYTELLEKARLKENCFVESTQALTRANHLPLQVRDICRIWRKNSSYIHRYQRMRFSNSRVQLHDEPTESGILKVCRVQSERKWAKLNEIAA